VIYPRTLPGPDPRSGPWARQSREGR
jgi:hypothetical protein